MIDYEAFGQALTLVFQFETLFWLCIGVGVGIGVGAMPGLQATTAIALTLPWTFNMPLASALGLLIGLYKGATYGGSISAIAFSTPGTPDSAATVVDGYRLMQRGHGRKAMLMALYASVTADLLSDVVTIVLAPVLAVVALKFGPSERFWVMMLAITLIGVLSGNHLAKGFFSAALGLFLGTIGTDPIGFISRNTFNLWWLSDGIAFAPMLIGIFAMSMVFHELLRAGAVERVTSRTRNLTRNLLAKSETLTLREYLGARKEIAIGFGVGSLVGLLPGLGGAAGAFIAYAAARVASPWKKIGSGKLEGVAAAEAGNNATVGPTLVPLLAFGIPGSPTAALIGGALVLQGVTPSPRMFELFPHVIYALFVILIVGNFVNLGLGRLFSFVYAKLGALPKPFLVPMIGIMAVVGTYIYEENSYHVLLMLCFGLLGLAFRIVKIPEAPLVITFLLAPLAEENMRRALFIGGGDWAATLFNGPLSIGLASAAVASIWLAARIRIHERIATVRSAPPPSDTTAAAGSHHELRARRSPVARWHTRVLFPVLVVLTISNVAALAWSQFLRSALTHHDALITRELLQSSVTAASVRAYFIDHAAHSDKLALGRTLSHLAQSRDVVSLKLLAADGTIFWAKQSHHIGLRSPLAGHLADAMSGRVVTAHAEHNGRRLLALYLPLRYDDIVLGVVKLGKTTSGLHRTLATSSMAVWFSTLLGAGCCYGLWVWLALPLAGRTRQA